MNEFAIFVAQDPWFALILLSVQNCFRQDLVLGGKEPVGDVNGASAQGMECGQRNSLVINPHYSPMIPPCSLMIFPAMKLLYQSLVLHNFPCPEGPENGGYPSPAEVSVPGIWFEAELQRFRPEDGRQVTQLCTSYLAALEGWPIWKLLARHCKSHRSLLHNIYMLKKHLCIYTSIHLYTYTDIHTYIHTDRQTDRHTYICTNVSI